MTADITLGHSAAFTWDEKGKATLRSFTCDCGEEVVDDVEDIVQVDEDTEITCPKCDTTYEATFLVKLVPYERAEDGSSDESEADEFVSPAGLINAEDTVDSPVQLYYESSISGNTKEVAGELTSVERGLRAVVEAEGDDVADPGDEFVVYGSEVSDRETGEVTKNGRKVGMFEEAEAL